MSTLYIYLNLCSPNPIIQLKYYKDVFKVNIALLYHFLKGVIPHFALMPLPLCHTLSHFWSSSLPYERVTYFLNGPLVFCMIIFLILFHLKYLPRKKFTRELILQIFLFETSRK